MFLSPQSAHPRWGKPIAAHSFYFWGTPSLGGSHPGSAKLVGAYSGAHSSLDRGGGRGTFLIAWQRRESVFLPAEECQASGAGVVAERSVWSGSMGPFETTGKRGKASERA